MAWRICSPAWLRGKSVLENAETGCVPRPLLARPRLKLYAVATIILIWGVVRFLVRGASVTTGLGGLGFVAVALALVVLVIATTCVCVLQKEPRPRASDAER